MAYQNIKWQKISYLYIQIESGFFESNYQIKILMFLNIDYQYIGVNDKPIIILF